MKTFKNRLVTLARNDKKIVEIQMGEWVKEKLSAKQVQKLAFMIYFIETEQMYR